MVHFYIDVTEPLWFNALVTTEDDMQQQYRTQHTPEAFLNGSIVEVKRGSRLETAQVLATKIQSRSIFVERVLVKFTHNNIRSWVDVKNVCPSGNKAGYIPSIHPALMAKAELTHNQTY